MASNMPITLSVAMTAGVPTEQVAIPLGFEMVAIIVASACGVLAAREHKLDFIGAIGLAVLCALGGGLIRDVILQEHDVYILEQPLALPVSIATAAATFVFPRIVEKPDRLIAVLDIFAVGLFAVMGADKAMVYGYGPTVCVMMGFFTAVGGGMLRDICLAKVPYIFQRSNLYAIAAIAGSIAYVLLVESIGVWNIAAAVASVVLTMAIRWLSLTFNIMSPTEVDLHRVTRIARPIKRVGMKTLKTMAHSRSRGTRATQLTTTHPDVGKEQDCCTAEDRATLPRE